jgi:hypothetical protein
MIQPPIHLLAYNAIILVSHAINQHNVSLAHQPDHYHSQLACVCPATMMMDLVLTVYNVITHVKLVKLQHHVFHVMLLNIDYTMKLPSYVVVK